MPLGASTVAAIVLPDDDSGGCIDFAHHGWRRARRRHEDEIDLRVEPRKACFGQGGHIRQQGAARWTRDGQRPHGTAFQILKRRPANAAQHQLDLVGQNITDGVGIALVGHVHQLDGSHPGKRIHGQVDDVPRAERAIVQRARPGPGQGHQFSDAGSGHLPRAGQHHLQLRKIRDRREVLQRIGQLAEQMRVEREDAVIAQQQGVAIGGGLGHEAGRDDLVAPGPVVDQHRLLPPGAQLLGHAACENVGDAPCGVGQDQGDRPVRKGLRRAAQRHQRAGPDTDDPRDPRDE